MHSNRPGIHGLALLIALAILGGAASGAAGDARGEDPAGEDVPASEQREDGPLRLDDWWRGSEMTGDWLGLRRELSDNGVRLNVFLNSQYQSVVAGGTDTNGGRHSASVDAILTMDLQRLGLIQGAEMLLHAQSNFGAGINGRTGSNFQVNDDADGKHFLHIGQAWYRQRFWDDRATLTAGFLDFQTILDRNAFANSEDRQFMHQVLDNNPLVPLNIGLGASLRLTPVWWYSLVLGVGDAQSVLYKPGFSTAFHDENWWSSYAEQTVRLRLPSDTGPLDGEYRVGLVYDPRPRAVIARPDDDYPPGDRGHDYGFYVSFDQMLYRESVENDQGLGVFGRFAYRTARTNTFARFWSAGLTYRGLVPGRDEDVLGFGFAMSRVSDRFRRLVNHDADSEFVYELYYAIRVNPWLVITPDIQYIDHPGAMGAESHAVVAGVRARVAF